MVKTNKTAGKTATESVGLTETHWLQANCKLCAEELRDMADRLLKGENVEFRVKDEGNQTHVEQVLGEDN